MPTRKKRRDYQQNKMHEMSIASSLLDIVTEHCKKEGYKGIESIKVRVGKASGIMPDSLLFAFDAIKIDTIAENATLSIEEIPVSGFCNSCRSNFTVEDAYVLCCPKCGKVSFQLETGRELDIYEMEVF